MVTKTVNLSSLVFLIFFLISFVNRRAHKGAASSLAAAIGMVIFRKRFRQHTLSALLVDCGSPHDTTLSLLTAAGLVIG